jgi:hypothetical protein
MIQDGDASIACEKHSLEICKSKHLVHPDCFCKNLLESQTEKPFRCPQCKQDIHESVSEAFNFCDGVQVYFTKVSEMNRQEEAARKGETYKPKYIVEEPEVLSGDYFDKYLIIDYEQLNEQLFLNRRRNLRRGCCTIS